MKKYAFTMLELVFVIVVVGILAGAIIPRMDRDSIYEAAEQMLGHIKYTQQLAMSDNVYKHDQENWHYARWQFSFSSSASCVAYRVGSDLDLSGNGFTNAEAALDPLSRYTLNFNNFGCTGVDDYHNDVLLHEKYAITAITSSCGTQKIVFDHLGRPYTGFADGDPQEYLMKGDCNYTLTDNTGNTATITVTGETGYSFITYN